MQSVKSANEPKYSRRRMYVNEEWRRVYMSVCILFLVHTCMCACVCANLWVCVCVFMHSCMCVCVCVCVHTYVCLCVCVHVCVCLKVNICICLCALCMCVCVCVCVCICVCMQHQFHQWPRFMTMCAALELKAIKYEKKIVNDLENPVSITDYIVITHGCGWF